MAHAETTGEWADLQLSAYQFTGPTPLTDGDTIRWGQPDPDGAGEPAPPDDQLIYSSYRFAGSTSPVPLDGTEFTLGTFTHMNFPDPDRVTSLNEVTLRLKIAFDGGAASEELAVRLSHHDPRKDYLSPIGRARKPPPDRVRYDPAASPHRITILSSSSDTVTIEGKDYDLRRVGFRQGGQIVPDFVSSAGQSNRADIVAILLAVEAPAPPLDQMRGSVSAGFWHNVMPASGADALPAGTPALQGVNTDTLRWSDPDTPVDPELRQNAQHFAVSTDPVLLNGTVCTLGTLTHDNFTTPGAYSVLRWATLTLRITLDRGLWETFRFQIDHEYPRDIFPTPADRLALVVSTDATVNIAGKDYQLAIWFKRGDKLSKEFHSPSGQTNRADIVASLVPSQWGVLSWGRWDPAAVGGATGAWTRTSEQLEGLEWLDSATIRWGKPDPEGDGEKSGYGFAGGTFVVPEKIADPPATPFRDAGELNLGTFTHENFLIERTPGFAADLKVMIGSDDGRVGGVLNLTFSHAEAEYLKKDEPVMADRVSVAIAGFALRAAIGDWSFDMEIGFRDRKEEGRRHPPDRDTYDGIVRSGFISPRGQVNTAYLVLKLYKCALLPYPEKSSSPAPEGMPALSVKTTASAVATTPVAPAPPALTPQLTTSGQAPTRPRPATATRAATLPRTKAPLRAATPLRARPAAPPRSATPPRPRPPAPPRPATPPRPRPPAPPRPSASPRPRPPAPPRAATPPRPRPAAPPRSPAPQRPRPPAPPRAATPARPRPAAPPRPARPARSERS